MSVCLLFVSWCVWLALGVLFTWLLMGAKAFAFTLSFIVVLVLWVLWFAMPVSAIFI